MFNSQKYKQQKTSAQYHSNASGQTYTPSAAAQQPQVYVPGMQNPPNQGNSPVTSTQQYSNSYSAPTEPSHATNLYIPAVSSSYQSTTASAPSFSQALDVPPPQPPVAPSYASPVNSAYPATPVSLPNQGYSTSTPSAPSFQKYNASSNNASYQTIFKGEYSSSSYIPASAPPTGSNFAPSVANSAVYNGGPTNGLVSEGNPTRCHKVDYEIKGHELQLVEIELDPNETVIAEAGALMFMDEGIDFQTKFGDGSNPKPGFFNQLLSAGGRILTGESLFLTHFTNKGLNNKARVAFAAPFPGNIVPINMQTTGGRLICQKDAFLCAAFGTKLALHFNKRLGSGFFGGEGFILQRLEGDGMAFIHAGGTVIRRELRNERLRLDTGCLVAFTEGIKFDIQLAPGLKTIIFGGEGIFLATLQGTGTVWMQSLPLSRFADKIVRSAPSIGGRRQGETDFVGSAVNAIF